MHSAAILAAENRELRAANAKQKRKQEKGCTYVAQEGALEVEEGLSRVQSINEWEQGVVEAADSQPQKWAACHCSVCGIIGHTACTCSRCTGNNS